MIYLQEDHKLAKQIYKIHFVKMYQIKSVYNHNKSKYQNGTAKVV